jgi:hypothetical protein
VQVLFHTLGIVMVDAAATDAALQALVAMARRNMSCVPVALAIATACVKLGQIPRARNQLKRIHVRSHSHPTPQYGKARHCSFPRCFCKHTGITMETTRCVLPMPTWQQQTSVLCLCHMYACVSVCVRV